MYGYSYVCIQRDHLSREEHLQNRVALGEPNFWDQATCLDLDLPTLPSKKKKLPNWVISSCDIF